MSKRRTELTGEEILERAIKLAEKNDPDFDAYEVMHHLEHPGEINTSLIGMRWMVRYSIIFNHDFAKALWGKDPQICSQCERHHDSSRDCDCGGWPISAISQWQHRLREMVLADDPIEYLGENLP